MDKFIDDQLIEKINKQSLKLLLYGHTMSPAYEHDNNVLKQLQEQLRKFRNGEYFIEHKDGFVKLVPKIEQLRQSQLYDDQIALLTATKYKPSNSASKLIPNIKYQPIKSQSQLYDDQLIFKYKGVN